MTKHIFLFALFLLFSSCSNNSLLIDTSVSNAQAYTLQTDVEKTIDINYLQFLPDDYESKKDWPLLLFLHGAGERGNDLSKVAVHGPPKMAAKGELQEFIVVAPQCPADDYWDTHNQQENLIGLLGYLKESLSIDENRVYVTGLSMGGFGTWHLATALSDEIAAVAPVCGGGNEWLAEYLKDVPIWAFHGDEDEVVPLAYSEKMVEEVNKAGGNAKLTIYPETKHDSWTETYANPELFKWLLSHSLKNRK